MKTQPRNKKGQYKKKKRYFISFVFLAMIAGGVYMHFADFQAVQADTPSEAETVDITHTVNQIVNEKLADKITALENEILTTLSVGCETQHIEDPDGAIILDRAASNDVRRMSIGRFMFQRRTIKHYVKMFEGRDISNAEAIAIAIDPVESTELARKVIFEKGNGHNEWYNCFNKHDLRARVEVINSLR